MKNISYKLKIERAKAGLTVGDLAEKSNLGSQTISRIEKGMTEPRVSTLGRIAKALNINVEELIKNEAEDLKVTEVRMGIERRMDNEKK